ncbi:protein FAM50A-like protein [Cinnamomum micranthum f. kanehirae]|uniref:Protein FAM50A-like protein n=1 Tax=Cinnamomum micranthum f. kanehirae TaxID=337451 RepID=A0A3S3MHF6_9MAGN|nr:protein FAM50A-like protein [Cinnamomum micranthum f. kanehirae]
MREKRQKKKKKKKTTTTTKRKEEEEPALLAFRLHIAAQLFIDVNAIGRNITACPKCLAEVRDEIKEYMTKKKKEKEEMNMLPHFDELANAYEDDEENDVEVIEHGKFLEAKFAHLYWTPCAAHCLDLMLEDIFKIPSLKRAFERAIVIHSKKRNRLDQKRLNDLVFVKYNRALKRRYDMRDKLDPISLKNIDESNEWLLGRIDRELDEDDEFVFDDDILTWGDVATASGVGESSQRTRATSTSRARATPRVTRSSSVLQLVDEEESEETDEEDVDGYKSNDEGQDYD